MEDDEFLNILTNPAKTIDKNSPIGTITFNDLGKPTIKKDSNFQQMKETSDDIISHFIKVSDGYEFGLTKQIDYFAPALTSLSLSQKNLLIVENIISTDNFRICSSNRDRLVEMFQLNDPNIIQSLGKDFAVMAIINNSHTSISIISLNNKTPKIFNIDLSKFHEKLFVNAKRYTNYLNNEQLQITACCSMIMLSCIEELSKIQDLNAFLTQVENKSLLKNIILNSSKKLIAAKNKAPLFPLRVLFYPLKSSDKKYSSQEMFDTIFSMPNEELNASFPSNFIDIETIFREFSLIPDPVLIGQQELWLTDIFVKKIEKCDNYMKKIVGKIKNPSCSDKERIISLVKIEYLKKVCGKSAENIQNFSIIDKEFSNEELSATKEELLEKITVSIENFNTAYKSIETEKQQLISKPLFKTYEKLFSELFKNEIEIDNILVKKTKNKRKRTTIISEQSVKKVDNYFLQQKKQKSFSKSYPSFVQKENLRRQQRPSSVPTRFGY